MKGITSNKRLIALALVSAFGLASCAQPVVDPATDTGTTTTTNTGTTNTGGGTTTPAAKPTYVVQLIASASKARAEQIRNEFAKEGYQAAVSTITSGGSEVHRVQIGAYGTQADAQRVLNQMRRRYLRNTHVKNAVVKTKLGQ